MNELEEARQAFVAAEGRLMRAVRDACPGIHSPKQHRDRKTAWCATCGRDDRGRQHASAFDLNNARSES